MIMFSSLWLRSILALLILGLSITYLAYLVGKADQAILDLALNIPFWVWLWSILLAVIGGIFNAVLWHRLMQAQNGSSSFSSAYWAWSVSRVFRYIPGKVFGFAVRHGLQKGTVQHGISASLNELIVVIGSLTLLGACFFIMTAPLLAVFLFVLALLFVFSRQLAISCLNLLPGRIRQFFRPETLGDSKQVLKGVLLVFPAMLAHTAAFYLIMTSGLGEETFSFIRSAFVLYFSGLAGQLAIVVPGGIGVREAAMAYMSGLAGVAEAVAVCAALVSRIILLFAELVNIGLSGLLKSFLK